MLLRRQRERVHSSGDLTAGGVRRVMVNKAALEPSDMERNTGEILGGENIYRHSWKT